MIDIAQFDAQGIIFKILEAESLGDDFIIAGADRFNGVFAVRIGRGGERRFVFVGVVGRNGDDGVFDGRASVFGSHDAFYASCLASIYFF